MAQNPPPIGSRRGQEGSRWYNERPDPKAVAKWFKENVPIDAELKDEAGRYVGGITLIEGWEYGQELRDMGRGNQAAVKVRNRVATPYMRVDTRILYFWEWCDHRQVVGQIAPIGQSEGMRPGFSVTTIADHQFVGCTMKVNITERAVRSDGHAMVVRDAPPATKLVPLLERKQVWENNQQVWRTVPDPYAHMKAETGAIGRALGFAGMLVVPGTGVATAEDIQEMYDRQATGAPLTAEDHAAAPSLPPIPDPSEDAADAPTGAESQDPDAALRTEAAEKLEQLERADAARHAEFQRWAREDRKFRSFDEITPAQLRGVVRKLDRELAAAAK